MHQIRFDESPIQVVKGCSCSLSGSYLLHAGKDPSRPHIITSSAFSRLAGSGSRTILRHSTFSSLQGARKTNAKTVRIGNREIPQTVVAVRNRHNNLCADVVGDFPV